MIWNARLYFEHIRRGCFRLRMLASWRRCCWRAAHPCVPPPPAADHTVQVPPNAGVYKVGDPYQIDNVWYYPREQPDYDETGIASWYGPDFLRQAHRQWRNL